MRWRRPEVGDVRVKRRFLLFPKTAWIKDTSDRETRWMEIASWKEVLEYPGPWMAATWRTLYWVDGK